MSSPEGEDGHGFGFPSSGNEATTKRQDKPRKKASPKQVKPSSRERTVSEDGRKRTKLEQEIRVNID